MNNNNKRLAINIIANCIAFAVNFVSSFFLTPYIINHVGEEAYGFVSLGNNFVSYASLIALAINSMASRFITIKIQKKDYETANKYFTSVLVSNIILCLILLIPSILIVVFLDKILDVPQQNVFDIKILWILLFINFFINIIGDVFKIATFAKDRVDLSAKRDIEAYVIKAIILILSYYFLNPYVMYIGIATIIYTLYNTITNIKYTKKLLPEIEIDRKKFDKKCLKELFFSGVWNTVSKVGSVALTELNLLLANILIDASAMGLLSVARLLPTYVTNFTSKITNAFMPQLTIAYAHNEQNSDEMLKKTRNSIRILLFFHSIIYGILISLSDKFFGLWLPDYDMETITYIYHIGVISLSLCLINAVSNVILNLFTVLNKLKVPSLSIIASGFISCICTYFVVKNTNLGLYAIEGISVMIVFLRNIIILMPYAAKKLKVPWYTFYKDTLLNIIIIVIATSIGIIYKNIFTINSWISFIMVCVITGITIAIINLLLVLKKEERKIIYKKLKFINKKA